MSSELTVDLRGVGKAFPGVTPTVVLEDVDLAMATGEYVALLGPSGSGKSTLLNVIGLLDRPSSGRYRLAGHETSVLADRERAGLRATAIGFVFQTFHLVAGRTARENVELPLLYTRLPAAERRHRATQALRSLGMAHRLDATVTTLSGGEQQRVAIARAVVTRPALLLCDEPTGNLDSVTRDQILDVIDGLHRGGVTIVAVTHDPDVAARAGRVVRIRDGRIEGDGGGIVGC